MLPCFMLKDAVCSLLYIQPTTIAHDGSFSRTEQSGIPLDNHNQKIHAIGPDSSTFEPTSS